METSICWVCIFTLTIGTQRKRCHRRPWTIIWNIFYDCETRFTVRAVDEWITETSVVGIEELAQTIRTNSNVRRDWLERPFHCLRVKNLEGSKSVCSLERDGELINTREWGSLVTQSLN